MKILQLDLRAFGPFQDRRLDLSGGSQGLHLIHGRNEAGKSSALRAIRQMLFGIDAQTGDDFLHVYKKLLVGGTLQDSRGDQIAFHRRKRNKDVLIHPESENPLGDDALAPFLEGVDRAQFEKLFGLNHDTLVGGGRAILDVKGDLNDLIFGAGSGLVALTRLRKSLDEEALKLFRPQGQKQKINMAIALEVEASRTIEAASLKGADWVAVREAIQNAETSRRERSDAIEAVEARRFRFDRIAQARSDVVRRRDLRTQIDNLPTIAPLPENCADRRREAETDRAEAAREILAVEAELTRIAENLDAIPIPGAILERASEVAEIAKRADLLQSQAPEAEAAEARAKALIPQIAEALRDLGRPHESDDPLAIDGLKTLNLLDRERVRKLGRDFLDLNANLKQHRNEFASACSALDQAEASVLSATVDPDESLKTAAVLRKALDRIRDEGNPLSESEAAEIKRSNLEASVLKARRRLAKLANSIVGHDPVAAEENRAIEAPAPEVIHDAAADLKETDRQSTVARADLDKAKQEEVKFEAAIRRLTADREVPTLDDLRDARAARDQLWQQVRAALEGKPASPSARSKSSKATEPELIGDFENHQRRSDTLSDRLRDEADRVAQLHQLRHDAELADDATRRARSALEAAQAASIRAQENWQAAWNQVGVTADTPAKMSAWTREHGITSRFIEDLDDARREAQALEGRVEACRAGLLAALGSEAAARLVDATLPALIDRASIAQEAALTAAKAAQDAAIFRDQQRKRRENARRDTEESEGQLQLWRENWRKTLDPLGFDPETDPDVAARVLDAAAKIIGLREKADLAAQQADDFARNRDRLHQDLHAMVLDIAPDLLDDDEESDVNGLDTKRLTGALKSRLTASEQDATRIDTFKSQQLSASERLEAARSKRADAGRRLQDLAAEAGLDDPADLPAVEAEAADRRQLAIDLAGVEERLRDGARGEDLDAFAAESEAIDPDEAEAKASRLADELKSLRSERSALDEEVGRLGQMLKTMNEESQAAKAADAALDSESQRARIRADAARFLQFRLASAVLRETIRDYQADHQAPTLEIASRYFARMTLNSFDGLRALLDDDGRQVLVGVRPGDSTLLVSGMSEGTRDQLYLALKLAALRHHYDSHPPMPLILDDIFINFDDDRSAAAFEVLAELSGQAQILFFTHNRHLVEIARETVPPDVLFRHELAEV